jgi:hyperosmotically inducible protein
MWDDSSLERCVARELEWDAAVDPAGIRVAVREGVVTLTGTVSCDDEREDALKAAARVFGVRSVVDVLTVRPRLDRAAPA